MLVLQGVSDFRVVSDKMKIPKELATEIFNGELQEIVGKISSFWLETKQSWKMLKEILMKSNEMKTVELAYQMEQYICEGTALCSHLYFFEICHSLYVLS